jgi:hypothetical protein
MKARISDIENVLFSLLSGVLGLPKERIVNERNPMPRPSGRFASFQIIGVQNYNNPSRSYTDSADNDAVLIETVGDSAYVTARITLFGEDESGEGSLGQLQTFASDVKSSWKPSSDASVKIGFGGLSEPKFIPDVLNGHVVDRSFVDFSFYAYLSTERPVDWFDRVPCVLSVPDAGLKAEKILKAKEE